MDHSPQQSPQPDGQHHREKSLGRGMLTIGWICVLGLLTFVFSRWESNQANPNQNLSSQAVNGIREVTLNANRQHHYLATGSINGETVTFLLDTGATDVVVPKNLAKQLGLKAGAQSYASTANGIVETRLTMIEKLTLGPIELRSVRASINPGMDGEEILLGMSALRQVELVQKNNQLTLKQLSH